MRTYCCFEDQRHLMLGSKVLTLIQTHTHTHIHTHTHTRIHTHTHKHTHNPHSPYQHSIQLTLTQHVVNPSSQRTNTNQSNTTDPHSKSTNMAIYTPYQHTSSLSLPPPPPLPPLPPITTDPHSKSTNISSNTRYLHTLSTHLLNITNNPLPPFRPPF